MYIKKEKNNMGKLWLIVLLALISTGVVCYVFFWGGFFEMNPALEAKSQEPATNKEGMMRVVRARDHIRPWEVISESKLEYVMVPKELLPDGVLESFEMAAGKRASSDIVERELLVSFDIAEYGDVYSEDDRLIEHAFQPGAIPASVASGSIVDIKLFAEGAKDCVVVSKAVVVSRQEDILCFYLNLLEQEYLKEAATEGYIFAVQYLDAAQKASDISYSLKFHIEKN